MGLTCQPYFLIKSVRVVPLLKNSLFKHLIFTLLPGVEDKRWGAGGSRGHWEGIPNSRSHTHGQQAALVHPALDITLDKRGQSPRKVPKQLNESQTMIAVYFSWLEQSWRLIHPSILGPGRDTISDKASPTTANPLLVLLNFIFSPLPMGSSHNRLLWGDRPPLPLSFINNSRDQMLQLRDLPAPDKDDLNDK